MCVTLDSTFNPQPSLSAGQPNIAQAHVQCPPSWHCDCLQMVYLL